ncbi:OadG family protein [Shewanella waksmanii]|uniref:OadG family protein n=1 Tax=Shewanella waksmanii TaxID=213783 RepID=UPI00048ABBCF|nr:OadG family transporter subunit [Shewanella waksmanii]
MNAISQQIVDALGIMLLGMGLVFLFLSMLILAIKLVAWKFAPETQVSSQPQPAATDSQNNNIDPKIVAAITAAIHQYRAKA